jgi:hypothetical protein
MRNIERPQLFGVGIHSAAALEVWGLLSGVAGEDQYPSFRTKKEAAGNTVGFQTA